MLMLLYEKIGGFFAVLLWFGMASCLGVWIGQLLGRLTGKLSFKETN
jgi:hypothetical protein